LNLNEDFDRISGKSEVAATSFVERLGLLRETADGCISEQGKGRRPLSTGKRVTFSISVRRGAAPAICARKNPRRQENAIPAWCRAFASYE
jgi:hypothetical protein